jgi:hypothetical protein
LQKSQEFLSPGGTLFETLAGPADASPAAPGEGPGHFWLVEGQENACAAEMKVLTPAGPARVESLGDLLDRLDRPPRSEADGRRHG